MEAPDGLVTLPDVARAAGVHLKQLRYAVQEELITPAPVRKRHNTQTFTLEDALFIVAVAGLAVAAGLAFTAMLRAIKASGGVMDEGSIKIPIPAINLNT